MTLPAPVDKRYTATKMTIAAGARDKWTVGFEPDLWQVLPSAEPTLPIFVAPRSDLKDGKPIRSGAESTIPGVGGDTLWFYNTNSFSVILYLTAQLGYPQGQLAQPISISTAETVEIQAQLKQSTPITTVTPITIQYPHPGGALAVFHWHIGVTDRTVVSITAGGQPLSLIQEASILGGNNRRLTLGFANSIPANNQLQVVITLSGNTEDSASFVISFLNGVTVGAADVDTWSDGTLHNIDVPCNTASKIIAICAVEVDNSTLTEGGGAILLDEVSDSGAWNGLLRWYLRRGQAALQTFALDPGTATPTVSIGQAFLSPD